MPGRRSSEATARPLSAPRLQSAGEAGVGIEHDLHAAGREIAERLRRAAGVGNHLQLHAGAHLEQLHGQMRDAAASGGGVGDFAGLLLGARDQLRHRGDAERRRHRDDHRLLGDEGDRQEVARHLQRQIVGDARRAGERGEDRGRRHIDRVAVVRRGGGDAGRDRAAAAGVIEHHHLLAPELAQPVGDDPGRHVGGAAGRGVADDPHRFAGVVDLRLRGVAAKAANAVPTRTWIARLMRPPDLAAGIQLLIASIAWPPALRRPTTGFCPILFGIRLVRQRAPKARHREAMR